jgi:hypothetical protein
VIVYFVPEKDNSRMKLYGGEQVHIIKLKDLAPFTILYFFTPKHQISPGITQNGPI